MELNEILESLRNRSREELLLIQSFINKELDKHHAIDEDLFYFILEELGEKPISVTKFIRGPFGPLWKANQSVFDLVLNQLIEGGKYKRIQIVALKRFLATILLDDLRKKNKFITIQSVCIALGYFTNSFDRAFPGYRKNHLGALLIAKLTSAPTV